MENFEIFGTALSTILAAIASSVATWAGTFFFYRQRKQALDIENESKQSEEWRKLYIDSQQDSARKDHKIDELRKEINELRVSLYALQRDVMLNSAYRCDIFPCPNRICNVKPSLEHTSPSLPSDH